MDQTLNGKSPGYELFNGKVSGSGPEGVVKKDDLLALLNGVQARYTPFGQPEIDEAMQKWFTIYHTLVLLVAATDEPKTNTVNKEIPGSVQCPPGSGNFCLEDSHRIPAYDPDEAGAQASLKWDELSNKPKRKNFVDVVLQKISIDSSSDDFKPVLQCFLKGFEGLPADFSPSACLEMCRASTPTIKGSHVNTGAYVNEALLLFSQLWGNQIEINIAQMRSWLEAASSDKSAGSETWLKEMLSIDKALEDGIQKLFAGNDEDSQGRVNKEAGILDINCGTLRYIYNRFEEEVGGDTTAQGLKEAIAAIKEAIETQSDQEAWSNLLRTTYGAIAWQIFEQAKLAVANVRRIVAGAPKP